MLTTKSVQELNTEKDRIVSEISILSTEIQTEQIKVISFRAEKEAEIKKILEDMIGPLPETHKFQLKNTDVLINVNTPGKSSWGHDLNLYFKEDLDWRDENAVPKYKGELSWFSSSATAEDTSYLEYLVTLGKIATSFVELEKAVTKILPTLYSQRKPYNQLTYRLHRLEDELKHIDEELLKTNIIEGVAFYSFSKRRYASNNVEGFIINKIARVNAEIEYFSEDKEGVIVIMNNKELIRLDHIVNKCKEHFLGSESIIGQTGMSLREKHNIEVSK
jgi:hypothetical protein